MTRCALMTPAARAMMALRADDGRRASSARSAIGAAAGGFIHHGIHDRVH
jgi:hypothetical protein